MLCLYWQYTQVTAPSSFKALDLIRKKTIQIVHNSIEEPHWRFNRPGLGVELASHCASNALTTRPRVFFLYSALSTACFFLKGVELIE